MLRQIHRKPPSRASLQKSSAGATGNGAKKLDRDIENPEDLLSEPWDFEEKLRYVAELHLNPDLNDGVVLNIAPLGP